MKEKIEIYYFSGTGNTKKIVDTIEGILNKECVVTTQPMEKGFHILGPEVVKLVFAFPANSQAVSPLVWKFFKSLPMGNGKRVFIITSLNESVYINSALCRLLKRKGYKPAANCTISMPNNMTNSLINEKQDNERIAIAFKKSTDFANSIISDSGRFDVVDNGSRIVSLLNRYTGLPWFFMRLMFKLGVNTELCTNCGLCKSQCPVKNIEAAEFPIHKNRCEFCMRCAANCPNHSIYIKGKKDIIIRTATEKITE